MSGTKSQKISFSKFPNVINGGLRSSEVVHQGINPSSKKPLWDVAVATVQDLDDAVNAGQQSFLEWSKTSWSHRQSVLVRLREVLLRHQADIANLIMLEGGKPLPFANLEVEHSAGFLDFYSKQAPIEDEVIQDDADLRLVQRFIPMGVVGAISPWNYPLVLSMAKISAALIVGNCVIVKPSPFTPYSILKFVEIAQAVLPPGVLQALNGDDMLGPLMTEHPGISKISFTGSTATGKKVMAAASKTLKNVTLELGGNNASIICADVDVDIVAPQVAIGSFFNSGQLCVASKRLYVHESTYAKFLAAFTAIVQSWKVGPVSEKDVFLGPVQNEMQYSIVKRFFEDCRENNYTFTTGGDIVDSDNYTIKPAIIDNPPDSSKIVMEEPFGPIVPILSWSTESEVISRVNNSTSGLGGAVWSSDLTTAQRLAHQMEAGTIWINSYEKPLPQGYFSGHKESGVGGEWGRHGLYSYCNAQSIHMYKTPVGNIDGKL